MRTKTSLYLLLIAAFFLAFNLLSLKKTGILHGGDTPRYTDGAERLLSGRPFYEKQASYFGYIAFVAFCQKYLGGEKAVVALQVLLSLGALFLVFLMAEAIGGKMAAYLSLLFYVTNPDLVQWNSFILTDSLYISSLILSTFCLWKLTLHFSRWAVPAAIAVSCTVLIRPTGWIMVPAVVLFALLVFPRLFFLRKWAVVILLCLSVLPFTVPKLKNAVEGERPANKIQFGEIICEYHDYMITMPQEPDLKNGGAESAVLYVLKHPFSVLKLGMARIFAVLAHARPYYSTFHNLQIFLMIYPTYLFALIGFYVYRKTVLQKLISVLIISHLFLIAISFADWDGRYLMQFFPLFQVMAGCGLALVLEKITLRLRSQRLQYQF